MLTAFLRKIRHRYHPFYQLKRSRLFSEHVLPVLDRPVFINLHGIGHPVRLRFMRHLSYIINNRVIEPGIAALFISICRTFEPKVFWDIGANIGFYSWLVLSTRSDAKAKLFEPDPENLNLIRETISRSQLERVEVQPAAVSDKVGATEFIVDSVSGFTGGIDLGEQTFVQRHYGLEQSKISVPTVTLDGSLTGESVPDFIKIDVEGAEHLVFSGARKLLAEVQPVIIFECSLENFSPLTERLKEIGYRLRSAEEPDAIFDKTPNVLALPPRLSSRQNELVDMWREELTKWMGADREN